MTGDATTVEQEDNSELILLAIVIVAALILGYKNREKIKKWYDDFFARDS